jgi:hypothetical protein
MLLLQSSTPLISKRFNKCLEKCKPAVGAATAPSFLHKWFGNDPHLLELLLFDVFWNWSFTQVLLIFSEFFVRTII